MKVSVVVSVYNEEDIIGKFHSTIVDELNKVNLDYEILYVNDGSRDKSEELIKGLIKGSKSAKLVSFSRNFGHEAAMLAGIDKSTGDCIICMDADLQHPPKEIPLMIEKFQSGVDVLTMIRTKNPDSNIFQGLTSRLFYTVLNKMSGQNFDINASDFFLISKKVGDVIKTEFREQSRFLRGFIQIMGFNKDKLEYEANQREAGESKYSFTKLLKFSFNVMLTFSNLPLRLGATFGILAGLFGASIGIWEIIMKFKGETPPGYATIVVLMSFLFAVLFILLGIIGEYLAVIFREVKGRPIYIIQDIYEGDDA